MSRVNVVKTQLDKPKLGSTRRGRYVHAKYGRKLIRDWERTLVWDETKLDQLVCANVWALVDGLL